MSETNLEYCERSPLMESDFSTALNKVVSVKNVQNCPKKGSYVPDRFPLLKADKFGDKYLINISDRGQMCFSVFLILD